MKMTIFLMTLFGLACALSRKQSSSAPTITSPSFFAQKYSEVRKLHLDLKKDNDIKIGLKIYLSSHLDTKDGFSWQLLIDEKSDIVIEAIKLNVKNTSSLGSNDYTQSYKPKCESGSTFIKYNLEKKSMALIKNNLVIFEGKSSIISDRLQDDKDKKCLNRWGN